MINEKYAKKFCRDDITLIENYDKAMNDTTQTWDCHHRDEIRTLASGMTVIRSKQELIDNDRYYNCPANELIFLTKSDHHRLHSMNISEAARNKRSIAMKGRLLTSEHKMKISAAIKGRTRKSFSDEWRQKISEAMKGKKLVPLTSEHKMKISAAMKGKKRGPFSAEHRLNMCKAWERRKDRNK